MAETIMTKIATANGSSRVLLAHLYIKRSKTKVTGSQSAKTY